MEAEGDGVPDEIGTGPSPLSGRKDQRKDW